MPQFDQFTFFNQVTVFIVLFFFFYFFVSYFLLPYLSFQIKFREKKINNSLLKKNMLNSENILRKTSLNSLYNNFSIKFDLFTKPKTLNLKSNNLIKQFSLIKNYYNFI